MAKVSFCIDKHKWRTASVLMVVSIGRFIIRSDGRKRYIPVRISTGISLPKNQWFNGRAAVRSNTSKGVKECPIAYSVNRMLDDAYDVAIRIATQAEYEGWTTAQLKNALLESVELQKALKKRSGEVEAALDWMARFVANRDDIQESTRAQQRITIDKLRAYEESIGMRSTWMDFDYKYYEGFVRYLSDKQKNTIGANIRRLKMLLASAERAGKRVPQDYHNFVCPSNEVASIYITEAELVKIIALDYSDNERLGRARDWFVIACNLGLRISDLFRLSLDNIDGRNVRIKTQKTSVEVVIPISKQLNEVITRYKGFPARLSEAKYNLYIKEVASDAKLGQVLVGGEMVDKYTLVSSHTARRTFATLMYQRGIPASSLMLVTGHKTEASFYRYIRTMQEENANLIRERLSDLFL